MTDRPILRHNRGPKYAEAAPPSTGGDDLSDLVAQLDALRRWLGYEKWIDLAPLIDGQDPRTVDRRGLVALIGKLGKEQRERNP